MVKPILLLGDDRLYEVCTSFEKDDDMLETVNDDLRDTLKDFQDRHGYGRAIAAPQIGYSKRMIYMTVFGKTFPLINPVITYKSNETMKLWDDCMSFPGLEVFVERNKAITVEYLDLDWNRQTLEFEGDLAELFQHEYDHLDGMLAVQRAIDNKSFRMVMDKK